MTVAVRKQQLQIQLDSVQNDEILKKLEAAFRAILEKDARMEPIFKPIRKHVTIDDLIREQNYTGPDKAAIDEIARKLNITEPLDELLAQLSR